MTVNELIDALHHHKAEGHGDTAVFTIEGVVEEVIVGYDEDDDLVVVVR